MPYSDQLIYDRPDEEEDDSRPRRVTPAPPVAPVLPMSAEAINSSVPVTPPPVVPVQGIPTPTGAPLAPPPFNPRTAPVDSRLVSDAKAAVQPLVVAPPAEDTSKPAEDPEKLVRVPPMTSNAESVTGADGKPLTGGPGMTLPQATMGPDVATTVGGPAGGGGVAPGTAGRPAYNLPIHLNIPPAPNRSDPAYAAPTGLGRFKTGLREIGMAGPIRGEGATPGERAGDALGQLGGRFLGGTINPAGEKTQEYARDVNIWSQRQEAASKAATEEIKRYDDIAKATHRDPVTGEIDPYWKAKIDDLHEKDTHYQHLNNLADARATNFAKQFDTRERAQIVQMLRNPRLTPDPALMQKLKEAGWSFDPSATDKMGRAVHKDADGTETWYDVDLTKGTMQPLRIGGKLQFREGQGMTLPPASGGPVGPIPIPNAPSTNPGSPNPAPTPAPTLDTPWNDGDAAVFHGVPKGAFGKFKTPQQFQNAADADVQKLQEVHANFLGAESEAKKQEALIGDIRQMSPEDLAKYPEKKADLKEANALAAKRQMAERQLATQVTNLKKEYGDYVAFNFDGEELSKPFESAKAAGNLDEARRIAKQLHSDYDIKTGEKDGWPWVGHEQVPVKDPLLAIRKGQGADLKIGTNPDVLQRKGGPIGGRSTYPIGGAKTDHTGRIDLQIKTPPPQ